MKAWEIEKWWINDHNMIVKLKTLLTALCKQSQTCSDSCSYLYGVPTLSPNHSQLAPLLNNHSFHLQFPATHAPPCFIKPSHPSQKHPHKRTTLLFVCPETRGTLNHFLFIGGVICMKTLSPFSDSERLCQHRKQERLEGVLRQLSSHPTS